MATNKIVGFVCKFCTLVSFGLGPRPEVSAKLELVELPCAGRIDARMILAAFENGADGVFTVGCLEHECLNLKGSLRADRRIWRIKAILDAVGLGGERLVIYHVSGTCGPRLAKIMEEMVGVIDKTGPNPLKYRAQGERSNDKL